MNKEILVECSSCLGAGKHMFAGSTIICAECSGKSYKTIQVVNFPEDLDKGLGIVSAELDKLAKGRNDELEFIELHTR